MPSSPSSSSTGGGGGGGSSEKRRHSSMTMKRMRARTLEDNDFLVELSVWLRGQGVIEDKDYKDPVELLAALASGIGLCHLADKVAGAATSSSAGLHLKATPFTHAARENLHVFRRKYEALGIKATCFVPSDFEKLNRVRPIVTALIALIKEGAARGTIAMEPSIKEAIERSTYGPIGEGKQREGKAGAGEIEASEETLASLRRKIAMQVAEMEERKDLLRSQLRALAEDDPASVEEDIRNSSGVICAERAETMVAAITSKIRGYADSTTAHWQNLKREAAGTGQTQSALAMLLAAVTMSRDDFNEKLEERVEELEKQVTSDKGTEEMTGEDSEDRHQQTFDGFVSDIIGFAMDDDGFFASLRPRLAKVPNAEEHLLQMDHLEISVLRSIGATRVACLQEQVEWLSDRIDEEWRKRHEQGQVQPFEKAPQGSGNCRSMAVLLVMTVVQFAVLCLIFRLLMRRFYHLPNLTN